MLVKVNDSFKLWKITTCKDLDFIAISQFSTLLSWIDNMLSHFFTFYNSCRSVKNNTFNTSYKSFLVASINDLKNIRTLRLQPAHFVRIFIRKYVDLLPCGCNFDNFTGFVSSLRSTRKKHDLRKRTCA